MGNKLVITVTVPQAHVREELEVPADLSANELIRALYAMYHLPYVPEKREAYYLCSNHPRQLLRGSRTLDELGIYDGADITIPDRELPSGVLAPDFPVVRFDRKVAVPNAFRIGVDDKNFAVIDEKAEVSFRRVDDHYAMQVEQGRVALNGTFVTNAAIDQGENFLQVGGYVFCLDRGRLYWCSDQRVLVKGQASALGKASGVYRYPEFTRSPRIREQLNTEPIKVLDPDREESKPENNLVQQLLPILIFAGIAMVSATTGMMAMMVISLGIGGVTGVLNYLHQKKKYSEAISSRERVYQDYIAKKREEVEKARKEEAEILGRQFPKPEKEVADILAFNEGLFDRLSDDDDFLVVRLGTGKRKAVRPVEAREQEQLQTGDALNQLPKQLVDAYSWVNNAPITIDLKQSSAIGVSGPEDALYQMFKLMMLDLAYHQYFEDVGFFCSIPKAQKRKFSWLRYLPYLKNEQEQRRNLADDMESSQTLYDDLYLVLDGRSKDAADPWVVCFLYMDHTVASRPVYDLMKDAADKHVALIFFEEHDALLPEFCEQLVKLGSDQQGVRIDNYNQRAQEDFRYTALADEQITAVSRKLAPVYIRENREEDSLPESISMFEMLGITQPEELDLLGSWKSFDTAHSLAAQIGVMEGGLPVALDLHERADGPHGLVAGTTGSGKSELLQTYILSMALRYSPYEVGFFLIDFKGGGMANQFERLPHLLGTITNIDGNEIQRSLLSLQAEVKRRQEQFAQYGVNKIDDYISLYRRHQTDVPLPHLIIIVDEFAELRMSQPEFMKELISIARVGRSLGIHLILATQQPSGIVDDQIWANSNFHLCLRVRDASASSQVLKSPVAATIRQPGRAYLQVSSTDTFLLFQSAFSGAPAEKGSGRSFEIDRVNLAGRRKPAYVQKKKKSKVARTELDVLVDYIARTFESAGMRRVPLICRPSLPDAIPMPEQSRTDAFGGLVAQVGIYDNPSVQQQGEMGLNITEANTLIIGAPQTGKTNLLQTMICSLAMRYSAEQVNFYLIDFGSLLLKNYEGLDHVGGVVTPDEDEKVKNLFRMLNQELAERKKRFAGEGVGSYASRLEAGLGGVPQIVVVIDNFTAFRETYLMEGDILLPLLRDGLSVGISFVIASSQTSGIGYRYLSFVGERIAFRCNDASDLNMLFGSSRGMAQQIPGRAYISKDNEVLETQVYLSSEGNREIDRTESIHQFVGKVNALENGSRAPQIPQVPKVVTQAYVYDHFGVENNAEHLVIGMDYETVAPVVLPFDGPAVLGMAGENTGDMVTFTDYLIGAAIHNDVPVYLLDNKLHSFESYRSRTSYSDTKESLDALLQEVENRMRRQPVLVVLAGKGAVDYISDQPEAYRRFGEILKANNGLMVFADLDNTSIGYGASKVLKDLKEKRSFLFFDDLSRMRLIDIPLSTQRKFARNLRENEAYYITENDVMKIKAVTEGGVTNESEHR